jgi:ubiquinone biosynthesis protein COQ4
MTALNPDFELSQPSVQTPAPAAANRYGKRDWIKAYKAFRKLRQDKEDTYQVFEIMRAMTGTSVIDGYHRLLNTPGGGKIAYERMEFADKLMDRAWVERFAPGTLGAAYAEFTVRENLSAEGLAEESRKGLEGEEIDRAHPYAWFGRRTRDVHDLWHLLTGYGRDGLGEACLTGFSFAQTKGLGWAFIAVGAALSAGNTGGLPIRRAIYEGYQRGKRCAWLLGEDYEALMAEPLEAARKRLNLPAPVVYNSIPEQFRGGAVLATAEAVAA